MAEDETGPRVYGTPAEEKQLPPATEGLRGEGSPTIVDPPEEQSRPVTVDGHTIIVAEASGTAFAESTGAGSKDGQD